MIVYTDRRSNDELLSDSFPCKMIENGMVLEVEGKWVVQSDVDIVYIGANPSAEGAEEDEGVTFYLQEQPLFDQKQFVTYMKQYIKNVRPKLDAEKQGEFKKHVVLVAKLLLFTLKDLRFFVCESMHGDGTMLFAQYKDGAANPTFLFMVYGLKEVTC